MYHPRQNVYMDRPGRLVKCPPRKNRGFPALHVSLRTGGRHLLIHQVPVRWEVQLTWRRRTRTISHRYVCSANFFSLGIVSGSRHFLPRLTGSASMPYPPFFFRTRLTKTPMRFFYNRGGKGERGEEARGINSISYHFLFLDVLFKGRGGGRYPRKCGLRRQHFSRFSMILVAS